MFVRTDLLQGFEILGFCCGVVMVLVLLECCMVLLCSLFLMLQDSFLVPFSRVQQSKKNAEAGGCMNIYWNSVTGDRLGRNVMGTSQHHATSQKSKKLL